MTVLDPALTLGAPRPALDGPDAIVARLLAVLRTRRGHLPWRPDFGCDLASFIGKPADPATLNSLDWRIRDALARWLPDVTILESTVEARPIPLGDRSGIGDHYESNLLGIGTQARVVVRLRVRTPEGTLTIEAEPEL